MSVSDRGAAGGCGLSWCTTSHGRTTHPDDEDHRSAGLTVRLTLRSALGVRETEAEVGLLRRNNEHSTWLVIEDGAGLHLELGLESAVRLRAAIEADPVLDAATAAP